MIKRDLHLDKISFIINDFLIKVIARMRRDVKSVLLLLIQEELKLSVY